MRSPDTYIYVYILYIYIYTGSYYGIILRNYLVKRNPGPLGNLRMSMGPPATLQGPLMDHTNRHKNKNVQRQMLSVAASESLRWNASSQRLPWTVLSCTVKNGAPFGPSAPTWRGNRNRSKSPGAPDLSAHIYMYIYVHIYICICKYDIYIYIYI